MTKGRTKPRKKGSKKKGSAAARKKKTNLWIKRLSLGTDLRLSDTGFKAPFWIMAALLLAITLVLSVNSGVNSDDFWQNKYAKNILPFYTSMGNDTTFLDPSSIGKVHYYGGFFEVIATGTSSLLGFDENDKGYHDIRHIYSGLLGVIAMVLAGLLIAHLMGWKAGLFAMLFLFLTPRFLGHSLMNPKDVPFATAYLTTIYFLTRILLELPRPKTSSLIGMAVGFGIAMGIRAGGLILVPYIFLFLGLDFILRYGVQGIFKERNELIRYAAYAFGTSIIGYAIGILFWPYALMDPINHPVEALRNFSQVWTRIKVLYGGDMIFSSSLPWHYPLVSILRTLPTFVLAGLVLSFVFLKSLLQRLPLLPVCLAYFAAFFPLLYVVANGSTLYDGWRHLLFVGPPIVICSLLGWWVLLEKLSTQLTYSRIAMGALFLMMLEPLIFTIRNHSYPYVYYNAVSGGVKKAFGNYELDYWGVGVKEAFDWLEEEGRVSPDMKDTVTIASNFRYCLSSTVRDRYNGKIKVRYVRLRQRDEVDWDYGIFVNRFVDGSYLRGGYWPTSKTIHMVKANNVPIAIIEQDEDKNAYQGNLALKSRDWDR
ncbi:MAG: glycosyltransferase family 39 protein, partial [Saprospiraceae bacterium]|nr:glycosyltransferase family 39 protein [Saprospiraceae bacterium]